MVGIGGNPFAREEPTMLPGAAWPGKPWSARVTIVDPTTGAVPMGSHHQQIRAARQCPVTLAGRHVAAPIGVLAILTGQVLSGEDFPRMTQRLSDRLARYGLLPAGQPANLLPGRGSVAYQLEGACREGIAARRHAPRRSPSRAALAVFQAALHLAEPCAAAT
jgi:hypothetical protein